MALKHFWNHFHLFSSLFIVSLLFRLVFFCLVHSLFLSSLLFFDLLFVVSSSHFLSCLCVSLSLSPCGVVCVVWLGTQKTPPCVDSKRLCVYRHQHVYLYMCHHEPSRTPQHSKWNCVGTNRPRHIHMNAPKI